MSGYTIPDGAFKVLNGLHRTVRILSLGRFGWTAGGMPALELTTIGRKSGQPRTSILTSPWQDGDRLAIIASAGGNDRHPAWFLNLRENPSVFVRTGGGRAAMTARITSGEERAEIWKAAIAAYGNYASYQERADREIPVVVLEPA